MKFVGLLRLRGQAFWQIFLQNGNKKNFFCKATLILLNGNRFKVFTTIFSKAKNLLILFSLFIRGRGEFLTKRGNISRITIPLKLCNSWKRDNFEKCK